jgi:hypothetical protein
MSKFIPELISILIPTKYKERRNFTTKDKDEAVRKQKGKCAICGGHVSRWERDFDHEDGNKSNNKLSNCRVVHTSCHRKKHAVKGDNKRQDPLLNLIIGQCWSRRRR